MDKLRNSIPLHGYVYAVEFDILAELLDNFDHIAITAADIKDSAISGQFHHVLSEYLFVHGNLPSISSFPSISSMVFFSSDCLWLLRRYQILTIRRINGTKIYCHLILSLNKVK